MIFKCDININGIQIYSFSKKVLRKKQFYHYLKDFF